MTVRAGESSRALVLALIAALAGALPPSASAIPRGRASGPGFRDLHRRPFPGARRGHAGGRLNAIIDDAPADVPNASAARSAGVPVIDLFDVFPAGQREALRAVPWDDHPNAAGHRLIAERLYPQLAPLLAEIPVRGSAVDTAMREMN